MRVAWDWARWDSSLCFRFVSVTVPLRWSAMRVGYPVGGPDGDVQGGVLYLEGGLELDRSWTAPLRMAGEVLPRIIERKQSNKAVT